jgi:hypothetical protein
MLSPAIRGLPLASIRVRPAGEVAFRDELGFHYDSRGSRIDRNGNIISPQTRTP